MLVAFLKSKEHDNHTEAEYLLVCHDFTHHQFGTFQVKF